MFQRILVILLLYFSFSVKAGKPNLDSLLALTNDPKTDSKIWGLEELCLYYTNENLDSALKYAIIGVDVCEKAGKVNRKASFLITLGNTYVSKNDFTKALDKYIEAEKYFKEIKNLNGAITAINNIGYIYERKNLPQSAIIQYETALSVAKNIGNKDLMADSYNLLGSVYYNQYDYVKALDNFKKALDINTELHDEGDIINALNNIAVVYNETGKHQEALENLYKVLSFARKNSAERNIAIAFHNIANVFLDKKDYTTGTLYLDSSIALSAKAHDYEALIAVYTTYSEFLSDQKNYEKAFEYYKLKFAANDSLIQKSRDKEFIEMSTKYGSEKKEAENKLLKSESEKQKAITFAISIGLALVAILSFFVFRGYRQKQKANVLLEVQNTEINEKKTIIEAKQKEILDSIAYAKRLQEAILPPIDSLTKYFESVFIYYQPKDIVAGDFYWMEHKNDFTFIAAADCTGHGVPGAMVSVVCSNALNRAVLEFNLNDPGKILDKTRDLVLETFSKSDKDVKDGMDISLLVINNKTKEIKWAGANNPLWYTKNGTMITLAPNKQPIGKTETPQQFTSHSLQLEKNSSVFLFTDGFADQFGGEKGKKFKYKQLQSTLLNNANLSGHQQRESLKSVFSRWKGNLEQVDDVCVIGIKI